MFVTTMSTNQHFVRTGLFNGTLILARFAKMFSWPRMTNLVPTFTEQEKLLRYSSHLDYWVVHLPHQLNIYNSAEIRKAILGLTDQQHPLLIDLSDLVELDSSGLAILIESLVAAKIAGVKLSIIGAFGAPLKMLQLTHLDKVFTLFERIEHISG